MRGSVGKKVAEHIDYVLVAFAKMDLKTLH